MNNVCIGLFGTCGSSTWRKDFITVYEPKGINFYNPQVVEWKPEDAAIEAEHLVNDDIVLFPVTAETYGTGSLAETGFSIMRAVRSAENRFVVVFVDPKVDEVLVGENPATAKESMRSRALVLAHLKKVNHPNVFLVNSLADMLELSVKLYGVAEAMKSIRTTYHKG